MDYKKSYEELVSRLERAIADDSVCDDRFCCVASSILDELRCSKFNRIRTAITNAVKWLGHDSSFFSEQNVSQEECVTWLNSQEEPHADHANDAEIPYNATDSELVEDKITIPDGCFAVVEKGYVKICKGVDPMKVYAYDKTMLEDITNDIFCGANFDPKIWHEARIKADWLKAFFLKAITKWTPTEKQISALEYQVNATSGNSWQYKESKELLEQLKKIANDKKEENK